MNPRLGISIPTYRRPEQLIETVRSIIASGGGREIPVIISDDSTDDTNNAAYAQLAAEYPFVQVHRNQENLGIDRNILRSVDLNPCEYAWIMGEDDRLSAEAIPLVLAALEGAEDPFLYVNYASVNADFSRTLKPVSLPLSQDTRLPAETFWRDCAWSAGFVGACVVRKADWARVDPPKYAGTWFAHVGAIMEMCHGHTVPLLAEPLVKNRCGSTEVFTWTSSFLDVLDGWKRLCVLLEPLYGEAACQAALQSFRRAHGLGTLKFLAYARAGGALTPEVARNEIRAGDESVWFKAWATVLSRVPCSWFRTLQRWKYR